jgi:hypothetical protein
VRLARLVPIALMLASAAALSAQIAAPLLGWLPEGQQIRRMNGLPAAATLGATANVGHLLAHIAVSPSQDYVLASDAGAGEVMLVIPGNGPGVSATTLNTPVHPDQIVTSPRGSSAILWFSSAAQFEILSGLPAAPTIRQIDASFLNTGLSAIAVSDDGQWVAAASSAGVYQWGSDAVPHQLYGGTDAAALAFLSGSSTLAIATSTQLLSVVGSAAGAGSATSVLYQGSFSPAGLAGSFDNQEIVLADQSGTIYSINAATDAPSIISCQCRPGGVFGLGGAVFRLTSSSIGPVKLFDAGAGAILAVPRSGGLAATRPVARQAHATAPLPTLTISLNPTPTGYLQQPAMTITASSAYASEIDGTVTLAVAPITTNAFTTANGGVYSVTNSAGTTTTYTYTIGTDQTIQFSTGGTSVNFTIPAGATKANFSGASSVTFSTGTIAGTITLTANVTAPTPISSVATQTVTTTPTFPSISSVKLSQAPGGVTVVVTGYSPTDDMIAGVFTFNLSSNATITANYISVPVSFYFEPYYGTTTSFATGSEFTLTVPFTVTGNPKDLVSVTVTMLNSIASSNPVSSQ